MLQKPRRIPAETQSSQSHSSATAAAGEMEQPQQIAADPPPASQGTGSKKVFILDTNILLVDPNAIDRFEDNVVVVSMTVLEELDGLKKRSSTEYEARQAIQSIVHLTRRNPPDEPVKLKDGGAFILDARELCSKGAKKFDLNLDKPDNRLLALAIEYREDSNYPDRVVIVTNDAVVRVKAHAIGVASEEYEAANFQTGLDDLYHEPSYVSLNDSEVNLWVKGSPVELSHDEEEPVLVRHKSTDLAPGFYEGGWLRQFGAPVNSIIEPLNVQQTLAQCLLNDTNKKIVALVGHAGTGKTILALAAAIEQKLLCASPGKIYIFRPNDQIGEDMGFLPGRLDEKFSPYKRAIRDAYEVIQGAMGKLKKTRRIPDFDSLTNDEGGGKMPILPINYIRGSTLHNAIVIIDEAQNFTPHQMKTLLTRAGRNTRILITGDPDQIDNRFLTKRSSGLTHVIGKMRDHPMFAYINLTMGERSDVATLAAQTL